MPDQPRDWNQRYAEGDIPWNTNRPSTELTRVLAETDLPRGRALEIGCGTGDDAIFLAQQGFEVTAFDLSPLAIQQAKEKAAKAEVFVEFLVADIRDLPDLGEPFPFVFDRGVYHVVRQERLDAFLSMLDRYAQAHGHYLMLAGNSNEANPPKGGPPRVAAEEICRELDPLMRLIQLRETRFDSSIVIDGERICPLAWSALFRRRPKT
jgi:SAM-dependent methyltransferase